ncbi:uncharacterized protein DUF2511 [Acinetobacter calcoaceticus]|uniref:Uncharacterized protein DUF2511 n=1 Tax=Acinetobacter calcoaceticus TaxID=471 RepID=A0A4R1Y7T9_ACICA|nr:uncharacterized protein DUF2511 [Acinetobacter calcoaceticus]
MKNILCFSILFLIACAPRPERPITQAEIGEEWPLLVDEGVLRCEETGKIIFRTAGKDYAVNGLAMNDFPSILNITQNIKGSMGEYKRSLDPIIKAGAKLCKNRPM